MGAILSVYNSLDEHNALGRNPVTNAEFLSFVTEANSPLVGTRPFMDTRGYWADNVSVGFDISSYEYISLVIAYDYIIIPEDGTYEFDIDSDDFGELWVDNTLVAWEVNDTCTTIPITLTAGNYSCVFKFQNGTGSYSFAIRWRRQGEATYLPLSPLSVNLPETGVGTNISLLTEMGIFPDYPHKLIIKTAVDEVFVPRRVEVRNRTTGKYIASALTDANGFVEFRRLPLQYIDEPHIVTCFDDRESGFLNALVFDRIFQVTDQGFPPEN